MKATTGRILMAVLIFIAVSASGQEHMQMSMSKESTIQKAVCVLYGTQGNNVSGTVTFTRATDGIKVVADVTGLSKGKHGFHIHEFGDCSSADGASAGGHFNPDMKPHGGPTDMNRHEGDMGNFTADETGKAHLEYTDRSLTFDGPHSIIGRSLIVHRDADDLKSQPAGNAGPRIACGVIGIAK